MIKSFHVCLEMRVDLTVTSQRLYLDAIFNVDGVAGMLEAKNNKHVEMVFSYLGAIVDRTVTALNPCITSTLPTYFEIIWRVYRRGFKA